MFQVDSDENSMSLARECCSSLRNPVVNRSLDCIPFDMPHSPYIGYLQALSESLNVISTAAVVNNDDTVDKKMLDVPNFYRMFTSNWKTVADSHVTVEACRRQSLVRSSET